MAEQKFDDSYDIIVVGYGYSGGIAAIEAHDAGAKVLLVDKMLEPGGISVCSYGAMRSAHDADQAFKYLKTTNAGRTSDAVLRALADGMSKIEPYMRKLAKANGAVINPREKVANYPFEGYDTFYQTLIEEIPNFDPDTHYAHVRGAPGGAKVFKTLEDNVGQRDIDIWLESPVEGLITADGSKEVTGAVIARKDGVRRVQAKKAVILACGGFEANKEMQEQFWQIVPVYSAASAGNTGDGIRMAQSLGAKLWHMWHFHGSYGFLHTDREEFPYGIRVKRFPDWIPGKEQRAVVQAPWIIVDQTAKRFMNEFPPYVQDTGWRPFEKYDPVTQSFPRIPAYLIYDELGRRRFPMGNPAYNDRAMSYSCSQDNLAEIDLGIITKADSIPELAEKLGLDPDTLQETFDRWNELCVDKNDVDQGRPAGTMMKIQRPPYYAGEIWPVLSNTQGGPEHDEKQRIINVRNEPISRLYAAGECGSSFGHLYLAGGNIAECFVTGRIAGREVANQPPLN